MFDVCHWFPKRSDDSRTRASVTALMEALAAIESQIARLDEQLRELERRSPVCTENLIRIDCVTESPNVNGDDRALLPLPDPVRLAVQVEEPTGRSSAARRLTLPPTFIQRRLESGRR